jgi:hypothetical protein
MGLEQRDLHRVLHRHMPMTCGAAVAAGHDKPTAFFPQKVAAVGASMGHGRVEQTAIERHRAFLQLELAITTPKAFKLTTLRPANVCV